MAIHYDQQEHLLKTAEFSDSELTSDDEVEQDYSNRHSDEKSAAKLVHDPRFEQPTPARWKRVALLIFIGIMFWVAFNMRSSLLKGKKQKVIFASR